MSKIIACVNQKGGVAKSTTIKNLSIGIALKGKKVLVVDLDPSGGLTKSLGLMPADNEGATVQIFGAAVRGDELPEGHGIVTHEEGIDLISSSLNLMTYKMQLISTFQRELILQKYLEPIKDNYDYILLDCPGDLDIFTMNALFCADSVIIPTEAEFNSVEAMQHVFMEIAKVRRLKGSRTTPEILGVLFTGVRDNTTNDKQVMQTVRANYEGKVRVFNTYIPLSTNIPSSDAHQKSIYKFAPNSSAAMVQMDFVNEILQLVESKEE